MNTNINPFLKVFRTKYEATKSIEEGLLVLKQEGASMMDSVRVLMEELKISLREADKIVMNSATWQESREVNQELRNTFFDMLEKRKKKTE